MSKSIKNRHDKHGVFLTWCGSSNKRDKVIANRRFRRNSKINLLDPENSKLAYDLREISNTWNFSSDGLAHYVNLGGTAKYRGEPYTDEEKRKFRAK